MQISPTVLKNIKKIVFLKYEPSDRTVMWAKPVETGGFEFLVYNNGAWQQLSEEEGITINISDVTGDLSTFNNDAGFITSAEVQTALSGNLKTVNNTSLLGSGNINIPKGDPLTYADLTEAQKADLAKDAVAAANRAAQAVETIEAAISDLDPSQSAEDAVVALAAKQGLLEADLNALGPKLYKAFGEEKALTPTEGAGLIDAPTNRYNPSSTNYHNAVYEVKKEETYHISAQVNKTLQNQGSICFIAGAIPSPSGGYVDCTVLAEMVSGTDVDLDFVAPSDGHIYIVHTVNTTSYVSPYEVSGMVFKDFQKEIDDIADEVETIGQSVSQFAPVVGEVNKMVDTYSTLSPIDASSSAAGQIAASSNKFNPSSSNYYNAVYEVTANTKYHIDATVVSGVANIGAVCFIEGEIPTSSGGQVDCDVLALLEEGSISVDFTPTANGHIFITHTIGTQVRISAYSVSVTDYIDFQLEIDEIAEESSSYNSRLSVLEGQEQQLVYTSINDDYDGRYYAYINSSSGKISAQQESTGRAVRYYRAVAGSKFKVKGIASSGNAVYTFLAFFEGNAAPAIGDTVSVIEAYQSSGLSVDREFIAPSNGFVLIGFYTSYVERMVLGNEWSLMLGRPLQTDVDLSLPSKITAIVGDRIQVFKRSLFKGLGKDIYDFRSMCEVGSDYPRYFDLLPVAADIGTKTLRFKVTNYSGQVFADRSCILNIRAAASNPSSMKRIALFGDSLMQGGQIATEIARRFLSNDAATPTMPAGNGLTNIKFIGAMGDGNARYYGVGGWAWKNYATEGNPAFRFQVTGVTTIVKGATYTNNGHTYTVVENNTTGGTGNILCETSSASNTPQASGTLTKSSGNGDATISFTSAAADQKNPLWDSDNGSISFTKYLGNIGEETLDCAVFLLGWNVISQAHSEQEAYMKDIFDALHSQYPSAIVKILGLQLPSLNGGLAANYGAGVIDYSDKYGTIKRVFSYNDFLAGFAADEDYSSFVEYIDVASQFDSENNMPEEDAQVNTRNAKTEKRGTNGVHPAHPGYLQIADVLYRALVEQFC